ncbi:hypothetical protein KKG83_02430 [Candidatus Micrarchaeota archaeon]|nr:hypothetical protein [Candidatus Micrarchaeota archaeon]MBU2476307.1 hypothetical protein [Candidatus Micrarchaeota archaeon]
MKFKYCPECGSIQLKSIQNALQCKKCSYSGNMKEDSIDVINSFVTSKKMHNNSAVQSTGSSQIIIQQEPKPDSLKERLKKFQNKDIEIL